MTLPRRARCVVCRALLSERGSSRQAPGPSVQRAMRGCPAVAARPLLWDCPQAESGPANAVSEPVTFSPPVIQSTAAHTSHIALPGLQPSRAPLTTLGQRASLISRAGEPLRYSVRIRGAQGGGGRLLQSRRLVLSLCSPSQAFVNAQYLQTYLLHCECRDLESLRHGGRSQWQCQRCAQQAT